MRAGLVWTGREGTGLEGAGVGATHGMAAEACLRSDARTALGAVAWLALRAAARLVAGLAAWAGRRFSAAGCFVAAGCFAAAGCCAVFLGDFAEAVAGAFLCDFAGRTGEPLAEIAVSAASTRTMSAMRFMGGARGDTRATPV